MKKWPSVIRQSLSTKLSLWLVAFVAVMLVAALFVMFTYARRAVKAEALAKTEAALDGMMQSIDNRLHEVEVAAQNIHLRVERSIDDPVALQNLTRKMLVENPSIVIPLAFPTVLVRNPIPSRNGMSVRWQLVRQNGATRR